MAGFNVNPKQVTVSKLNVMFPSARFRLIYVSFGKDFIKISSEKFPINSGDFWGIEVEKTFYKLLDHNKSSCMPILESPVLLPCRLCRNSINIFDDRS